MKHLDYLFKSILLSVTLTSLCSAQTSHIEEQLNIYSNPTEIGTIAKRTFRDPNGRIYKEIFSTLRNDAARAPYSQDMLKEQSTVLYTYNDQGQNIRSEHYDGRMHLEFVLEVTYQGSKERREIKYTPEGIRQYEIRYIDKRSVSHLHYDESGKNLVSVRGLIPNDVDLPFGWGKEIGGLACGIVLTQANSLVDELPGYAIYVNIRNIGSTQVSIPELPPAEMELRDSTGKIVREGTGDPTKKQKRLQLQRLLYGQLINPGEAGFVYPPYELNLYYVNLLPGRYSIRVRQPIGDNHQILISNNVFFEVGGQK